MLFVFRVSFETTLASQREHHACYPNRNTPSVQVFTRLYQRLLETGSVQEKEEVSSLFGAVQSTVGLREYRLNRVPPHQKQWYNSANLELINKSKQCFTHIY